MIVPGEANWVLRLRIYAGIRCEPGGKHRACAVSLSPTAAISGGMLRLSPPKGNVHEAIAIAPVSPQFSCRVEQRIASGFSGDALITGSYNFCG